MRLVPVKPHRGIQGSYSCHACRSLAPDHAYVRRFNRDWNREVPQLEPTPIWADADGPAFGRYFCDGCAQIILLHLGDQPYTIVLD